MDFNNFFDPRSVAVIGASNNKSKVGYALLYNLLASGNAKIFPINPKETEILDTPCYPSILDVPEKIELAVIAVPAKIVPQILKECGEKKIPFAVVISAGFKEVGESGAELGKEIIEIAKEHNIWLLGPNCLGIIDMHSGLNATFGVNSPDKGGIALLSQSGALGTAMLDWAKDQAIGLSKFVSLGNEAVLTELDFLEFLKYDEQTKAILLYLEKVSDGKNFMHLVKEITKTKPVVVLKAGRSSRGGEAIKSHTGSIASENSVFETVCKQNGVIVVHSLRELFDIAKLFDIGILKPLKNLAILTNGGGPSIVTADLVEFSESLSLVDFSEEAKEKLKAVLPKMASVGNPIDLLGDAPSVRYRDALEILVLEKDIDAILTILTPQMMTEAKKTAEVLAFYHNLKPIIPIMIGAKAVQEGITALEENGLVNFNFPEDAILALDNIALKKKKLKKPAVAKGDQQNLTMMSFYETDALLTDYNIDLTGYFVKTREELEALDEQSLGQRFVIKALSEDIVHKTDMGVVKINLEGKDALLQAWDDIISISEQCVPPAKIEGMLIQPMVQGKEIIIGMKRDSVFGPTIVFGLGGIFVEVFKDVSMRVPKIDETIARSMIEEIKGFSILNGLRGEKPVNFDALIQVIMSVARLSVEHPEIKELDLNPVIVNADSAHIVDARLMK
ncbi:MAG: acetate--CoA ligase family protein [Candidatus Pacebacteria bacterium]|nr:acetate--CoA ligase family protein [Candidatus Paceibacterota bacterium]